VFFGASDDLAKLGGYVNLLDVRRDDLIDDCKYDNRYEYEDVVYRGKYDLFENCGESGNVYIVLTAVPRKTRRHSWSWLKCKLDRIRILTHLIKSWLLLML